MKYYLYIILTVNNTLYTGITSDIVKRFEAHLKGRGAKYLKANKPLKIVYLHILEDKSKALKEEYRIKKTLSKKEKLTLIDLNKDKTEILLKQSGF